MPPTGKGRVFCSGIPLDSNHGFMVPRVTSAQSFDLNSAAEEMFGRPSTIRAYVAEQFPDFFGSAEFPVHVLRPERTFWEKVTLLHAVMHSGKLPPRISRHYYDVSRMYRHDSGRQAFTDPGLLEAVVKHKSIFFREAAARYDLAVRGSLKIVPGAELERAVRRDYREMQEMFFGEAPEFDAILANIRDIEQRVNSI